MRQSGEFIGADALEAGRVDGATCRIVSLTLQDTSANLIGHEPIYLNGEIIGQTTSCAFGYRVNHTVALGSLRTPVATGTKVQIDCARRMFDATLSYGAVFDPTSTRMRTT